MNLSFVRDQLLRDIKTKLLLLSCSKRKQMDESLMPAIDRYDGPAFRVLRRYFREDGSTVEVRILSAKYGLIAASHKIPYYDLQMTWLQSQKIRQQVVHSLDVALQENSYSKFLICLGKNYLQVINGYEDFLPKHTIVKVAEGSLGRKLSVLHDWLYEENSKFLQRKDLTSPKSKVTLRGIEINTNCNDILNLARKALYNKERGLNRYYSWCVYVDGQGVSPKWLVSKITSLPVNDFTTDQARRVLAQLGVEVTRR